MIALLIAAQVVANAGFNPAEPPVSIGTGATPLVYLAVEAPPCGTPEAGEAHRCVRWVVRDANHSANACDLQWEANAHQWAAQELNEQVSLMLTGKIDSSVKEARSAVTTATAAVRRACPRAIR